MEGDLTFDAEQTVTVETIEDEEWYSGSYTDPATGEIRSGIFPRNFVETLSSEVVPDQGLQEDTYQHHSEQAAEEPEYATEPEVSTSSTGNAPPVPVPSSFSVPDSSADRADHVPPVPIPAAIPELYTAPAPSSIVDQVPSLPSNNSPPAREETPEQDEPSTEKKMSLRERIAAFNNSSAPTPFNQPKPSSYSKKPFHAAPTNSYVPQLPQSTPKPVKASPPKVPAADIVHYNDPTSEEEDAKPQISLKERIKLLQQQQAAEAARAEALTAKKKQKAASTSKAVAESGEEADAVSVSEPQHRPSIDSHAELERATTGGSLTTQTTDGSGAASELAAPEQPATHEPDPLQEESEEEEEEEEDSEEARRLALRERMAKISGGMGMPGMGGMGMPMPGMAMPGFGGPSPSVPKKKKAVQETTEVPQQAPVPIFPFATGAVPEVLQRGNANAQSEVEQDLGTADEPVKDPSQGSVELAAENTVLISSEALPVGTESAPGANEDTFTRPAKATIEPFTEAIEPDTEPGFVRAPESASKSTTEPDVEPAFSPALETVPAPVVEPTLTPVEPISEYPAPVREVVNGATPEGPESSFTRSISEPEAVPPIATNLQSQNPISQPSLNSALGLDPETAVAPVSQDLPSDFNSALPSVTDSFPQSSSQLNCDTGTVQSKPESVIEPTSQSFELAANDISGNVPDLSKLSLNDSTVEQAPPTAIQEEAFSKPESEITPVLPQGSSSLTNAGDLSPVAQHLPSSFIPPQPLSQNFEQPVQQAQEPKRELVSVIRAHKDDSDDSESDSAWSDSEPVSRRSQRSFAPNVPTTATEKDQNDSISKFELV